MTSGSLVVVTVVTVVMVVMVVIVAVVVVQRYHAMLESPNRIEWHTATATRPPATPRALRRATWLPGLAAT
jgi:hypothetical protein